MALLHWSPLFNALPGAAFSEEPLEALLSVLQQAMGTDMASEDPPLARPAAKQRALPGNRVAAVVANMPRHMPLGNREVPMNVDDNVFIPDNFNDTTNNEVNAAQQQRSGPGRNYLSISDIDRPPGPAIIVDVIEPSD